MDPKTKWCDQDIGSDGLAVEQEEIQELLPLAPKASPKGRGRGKSDSKSAVAPPANVQAIKGSAGSGNAVRSVQRTGRGTPLPWTAAPEAYLGRSERWPRQKAAAEAAKQAKAEAVKQEIAELVAAQKELAALEAGLDTAPAAAEIDALEALLESEPEPEDQELAELEELLRPRQRGRRRRWRPQR